MAQQMAQGTDCPFLVQSDIEEVQQYAETHGIDNLAGFIEQKLKGVSLKIALIGIAGAGKSQFANTFRGLTGDDEGAAPVGNKETTLTLTEYPHPNNSNIKLCDLPGVGTANYPRENYLSEVDFDSYDYYMIITKTRVFDNDIWLAEEAQNRGKRFFIVRTHIDVELDSIKKSHPKSYEERQNHHDEEIRIDIVSQLSRKGITIRPDQIFLLSTCLEDVDRWDYRKLEHEMMDCLPRDKREVLTLSLSNLSTDFVKEKCKILRRRVWQDAIYLTIWGLNPFRVHMSDTPAETVAYVIKEVTYYRDALGLDENSLRRVCARYHMDQERLDQIVLERFGKPIDIIDNSTVVYLVENFKESKNLIVPALHFLKDLIFAYYDSYKLLLSILERLENVSLDILNETMSKNVTDSLSEMT